jgi:pseudouridine kinase
MVEGNHVLRIDGKIQPYCVVVGGINIDIQAFCHTQYIMKDSNPGCVKRCVGGVGRNIAENLVRLGLHTEMITVLGDSTGWKRLIAHTEHTGIGLDYSPRLPGVPLPTYLCILERDGGLVGAVADMGAVEQMRVEHLKEQQALLDGAAAIIVDGNIPQACIEWLAARYGTNGSRNALIDILDRNHAVQRPLLAADPVSSAKARKFRGCFGRFDIAKPNIVEVAVIAGTEKDASLSVIISAMRRTSNIPRELYVSTGEHGIEVIENDCSVNIPLPPPELRPHSRNLSGAGDAACAALVWVSIYERLIAQKRWEDGGECESKSINLCPQTKAKIALAAALYAASSEYPVNRRLTQDSLCKTIINCYPELADVINDIRMGLKYEHLSRYF